MNSFFKECPSTGSERYLRYVTAEEIRSAFTEHPEELEWLALFLTGDKQLANVCMVDACAQATTPNDVFVQWVARWTRRCTIRSAVEMQPSRILLLASVYERTPCHANRALAPVILDLLYDNPEELGLCLDVLSRAALVLHGIEGYSLAESALILGVSRTAVEAAYCTALEFFEVLSCKMLVEADIGVRPYC